MLIVAVQSRHTSSAPSPTSAIPSLVLDCYPYLQPHSGNKCMKQDNQPTKLNQKTGRHHGAPSEARTAPSTSRTLAVMLLAVVNVHLMAMSLRSGHMFCWARVLSVVSSWAHVPLTILYAPLFTTLQEEVLSFCT